VYFQWNSELGENARRHARTSEHITKEAALSNLAQNKSSTKLSDVNNRRAKAIGKTSINLISLYLTILYFIYFFYLFMTFKKAAFDFGKKSVAARLSKSIRASVRVLDWNICRLLKLINFDSIFIYINLFEVFYFLKKTALYWMEEAKYWYFLEEQ